MTSRSKDQSADTLIVFGLDGGGKPKGARFSGNQIKDAKEIATALGLSSRIANSEADLQLSKKLPLGRLLGRGKAYIPFVKRELYDKLASGQPTPLGSKEDQSSSNDPPPNLYPQDFDSIQAGSIVLVHESMQDGWWEAVVLERKTNVLTLRFRDYPKIPRFVAELSDIGLIYPAQE